MYDVRLDHPFVYLYAVDIPKVGIYQPADLGIHTSVEYTFVVANGKNNISILKLKQIQKFYFQVIIKINYTVHV